MSWIKVIDVPEAEGALREAYEEVASARARLQTFGRPTVFIRKGGPLTCVSIASGCLVASELTRAEREMIAVAVSVVNHCHYGIKHHGEALRTVTKDDELLAALERDPETARLDQRQRALIDYALKLTRTPEVVTVNDIERLRDVGLSDAAIHDGASITAYFNFVNRMASGLGVDLEEAQI